MGVPLRSLARGVLTVLSGMTYMEHLRDNLATYSPLEPLSEEESEFLKRMAQALLRYPTIPCNDCKYCMPCPYGLDIPGILLHYNRCVNEGRLPSSSGDENYRRARREFLIGYDRSVPRLRQADHCIGCKECVRHCPQRIDIPGTDATHRPLRRGLEAGQGVLTGRRGLSARSNVRRFAVGGCGSAAMRVAYGREGFAWAAPVES